MNNIGTNISVYANVVTPFNPLGKQAVGLENAEAKEEVFAPVEEASANDRTSNNAEDAEIGEEARRKAEEERSAEEERLKNREEEQQQREDQAVIRELAARDREVRAHEQAHAAVGGQYAGSPSYTFKSGPDGVKYAVGGEVSISLPSGEGDPRQKLAAAEQVHRAALAPADPSTQDRRIAAAALALAQKARAEIAEQRFAERGEEKVDEADKQSQPNAEKQTGEQNEQQQASREQRLEELFANSRRTAQLGERLATQDKIERSVGAVLDQLA